MNKEIITLLSPPELPWGGGSGDGVQWLGMGGVSQKLALVKKDEEDNEEEDGSGAVQHKP